MVMNMDYEVIRDRFRKVFAAKWDRSELDNYDELCEKFAFHMADVCGNFASLAEFYQNPISCDAECLAEKVELFYYDCMPHLMAAANIYDDIPRIFEEQDGVHDWSFKEDDVAQQ